MGGLHIGVAEVEITPPEGLLMCGGLEPRTNAGTDDPLLAKALVAESGGRVAVIVGVDLIGLPRAIADEAIAAAAGQAGVPAESIMVSCSHTHSGPYTMDGLYCFGVTDAAYLATLPERIAAAVARAAGALRPATMHVGRSLVHHGLHHRRVLTKDGRALNTWLGDALNDLQSCPQVLGSCGPIDPELWLARFDDRDGRPFAALANFSLHVNSHFGSRWSADYPGVIAERMRQELGPEVVTVFTPGACADVNPTLNGRRWREGADYFAERALAAARGAYAVAAPIAVDAARRDVAVPRRQPVQAADAVSRLRWGPTAAVFDDMIGHIGAMPPVLSLPVNAARIGPLAIASNPGEPFVEHGLAIKRRSPFRHTVVAELTNDLILYQPTRQAMAQGGYETLVGANRVAIDGIEAIVDTAVDLLEELHRRGGP